MSNIIACILSSTSIFLIFRWSKNFSCQLTNLISLNYLFASLFGFIFILKFRLTNFPVSTPWMFDAIILGTLFMVLFLIIGYSSQKAGVAITTLSNKLSLVFPVLFSLIWFGEKILFINYIGLAGAFIAVGLTLYRKEINRTSLIFMLLPVIIFIGGGFTDSLVKYAQATRIPPEQSGVYSFTVFLVAFVVSIIPIIIKKSWKNLLHTPTLILGLLLGTVNFGSLFFLINALNKSNIGSSLVFAIINMSIVSLSAISGRILFKEHLSKINLAGILLAIASLYLLLK